MKKFFPLLGLLLLPIHSIFASDAETDKLQWHLNRVEGILRKVDTSSLTEEQKVNRTKMLDRLHSYTEDGKFPNNDKFPGESVPFFRGSNGNLCAVGYLMDADPEYKPFIETIVQTNNNVRIMDVQDNPTLNIWAKKYGFSILELAMIQPTYDTMSRESLSKHFLWIGTKIFLGVTSIIGIFLAMFSVKFFFRKNDILGKKYLIYSLICVILSFLYIPANIIINDYF